MFDIGKCALAVLSYRHFLQCAAVLECKVAHSFDAVIHYDFFKRSTLFKCVCVDSGNVAQEGDLVQCGIACECSLLDILYAYGDRDSVVSVAAYVGAQQVSTACKGSLTQYGERRILCEVDVFELDTVLECTGLSTAELRGEL